MTEPPPEFPSVFPVIKEAGPAPKIRVLSKDAKFRAALVDALEERGLEVEEGAASNPGAALIADLEGLDAAGRGLLDKTLAGGREEVLVVTGPQGLDEALAAVRQGASLYLLKGIPAADMARIAHDRLRTRDQVQRLGDFVEQEEEISASRSPAMQHILRLAAKAAPSEASILITGESGTGKELVARYIHQRSLRRTGPLVAINCAAVQETLMETELFGHVKGAFTGALRDKAGLFEVAAGGTAFLDEVGDLPLTLQARLLRFLQNRELRRVGDTVTRKADVRILAATHRDLPQRVKEGAFREDLFFRLNVIPIHLPPLRDRKETIPDLVRRFVILANAKTHRRVRGVDPEAQAAFMAYDYPGNVRELENLVDRAVTLADGDVIRLRDLPEAMRAPPVPAPGLLPPASGEDQDPSLSAMERNHIARILARAGDNKTEAAKLLGISRSTLWRKLKEHGLEAGPEPEEG